MRDRTEWEEFFDGHAPIYMKHGFTKNTAEEVDFAVRELHVAPGARILDVGCGTGRHAIELARRGYLVTGIDISSGMLAEAKQAAAAANVDVTWVHANATEVVFPAPFDAAICLCEGAFGLLGSADDALEQPLAILGHISAALKPQARCLFTVLNGLALARKRTQTDVEQGVFDPLTFTEISECSPTNQVASRSMRERAFVPTELNLLFRLAGLKVLHIWGGTAGNWRRRPIDLDEIEIMVVGQKSGGDTAPAPSEPRQQSGRRTRRTCSA